MVKVTRHGVHAGGFESYLFGTCDCKCEVEADPESARQYKWWEILFNLNRSWEADCWVECPECAKCIPAHLFSRRTGKIIPPQGGSGTAPPQSQR